MRLTTSRHGNVEPLREAIPFERSPSAPGPATLRAARPGRYCVWVTDPLGTVERVPVEFTSVIAASQAADRLCSATPLSSGAAYRLVGIFNDRGELAGDASCT